jgi:uncharacterized protein with FMN-binding domain
MRRAAIAGAVCAALAASLGTCAVAPAVGGKIDAGRLVDGTYEGRYRRGPNSVVANVTISAGRIEHIELTRHIASWIGKKANGVIERRIVENQSTKVDAVSGATNSSHCIMNAVQQAVEKASRPAPQREMQD